MNLIGRMTAVGDSGAFEEISKLFANTTCGMNAMATLQKEYDC